MSEYCINCERMARRVGELEAEVERWREIATRNANECPACDGEGFYDVCVRVEPPDGHEVMDAELCSQCAGTGRWDVREMWAEDVGALNALLDRLPGMVGRLLAERYDGDAGPAIESMGAAAVRDAIREARK